MKELVEARNELEAKRKALAAIFEEAGADMDMAKIKSIEGDTSAKAGEIKRRNDDLTVLGKKVDELVAVEEASRSIGALKERGGTPLPGANDTSADNGGASRPKGVDEILASSGSYKAFKDGQQKSASFEFSPVEWKTLLTLADISPSVERQPLIGMAGETATIRDMMGSANSAARIIEYYEQTTRTNAAVEVAEGAAKPEGAIDFTLRQDPVSKIAVWIPATTEVLRDIGEVRGYIENELRYMLDRRIEAQLIAGDGTAPNLSGILDRTGLQTQAKGADPTPDAIYKAMTKIRVNAFADPTGFVVHPNDWQEVRLLRTADGLYIWGSPSEAGLERIWGLPVRQTTAIAENTGLVGAFRPWSTVVEHHGVTVTVSTEHSTYFIENKVAILAETELFLRVTRPAAFCSVMGI